MNRFEEAIKAYLDERAANDPMFAIKYANEKKSIEECCKFIECEAYEHCHDVPGGKVYGMTDDEVFGLAVHYYDEEDIEIKGISGRCEVRQTNVIYDPTEEEKAEARQAALKRLEQEAYNEIHGKKKAKPVVEQKEQVLQTSLFD
jgi:hypothetical protein